MSRDQGATRERILTRALQLFNEQGIEGVGMRDIARTLSLSPGNLTYHFARKEDIVVAIGERLTARNVETLYTSGPPDSLVCFLESFRTIFHNQYEFRCLLLGFVHVNEHYPLVAQRYRMTQSDRRRGFAAALLDLQMGGYFRENVNLKEIDRMAGYCALIGRFWLSEYWVDYREKPVEEMIDYYLSLLAGTFLPFAAPKGQAELLRYLE